MGNHAARTPLIVNSARSFRLVPGSTRRAPINTIIGAKACAPPHGASRLPAGHWVGERAATDILVRKGRAFRALDTLITQQGGQHVLYGSALALAAATHSWSRKSGTPIPNLTRTIIH